MKTKEIKIVELIKQTKEEATDGLDSLKNPMAKKFLKAIFHKLRSEIEATSQGVIKVAGLGVFRIKEVEVEKDDGIKKMIKRIKFIPQGKPARIETIDNIDNT